MKILAAAALTAILALTGCATHEQSGRVTGGLTGAAIGGLLGDATGWKGGAAVGAVVGGLIGQGIGGSIGANMDRNDRMYMNRAIHENYTGQKTVWRNPDTQATYTVQPTRTYQGPNAQPCREVIIGKKPINGKMQEVYADACYDGAGAWKVKTQ